MTTRVPINGATLRWARETLNMDLEELARAAGIKRVDRIHHFEEEIERPTLRQMTLIAKRLDRPLAFFFTPTPLQSDVPTTIDYRSSTHPTETPPTLLKKLKRAEEYRRVMLELSDPPQRRAELGKITWDNAAKRASEFRAHLDITLDFVPTESRPNQVFNFWRNLLEVHGYLVFQTTRIDLSDFRGLSIYHDDYPLILVNAADAWNGKIFTLFHEVAHLVNRTNGLCVLDQHVPEEAICNAFAANVLMPEGQVLDHYHKTSTDDMASAIAHRFKVSRFAAGVRLRTLRLITPEQLDEIRRQSDNEWIQFKDDQKRNDGFPPPWRLRYRDLGETYIGVIAHAVNDERIDLLDATYLLDTRLPTVERLIDEFYRTERRG